MFRITINVTESEKKASQADNIKKLSAEDESGDDDDDDETDTDDGNGTDDDGESD